MILVGYGHKYNNATMSATYIFHGGKPTFHVEVSGNKDVIVFPKFMYLPNSIHGQPPSRLRTPATSRTKLGLISPNLYALF